MIRNIKAFAITLFLLASAGWAVQSQPVFAKDYIYMNETMDGVADSEYFVNNHWGGRGEDYLSGQVWATGWGGQGFFSNAPDNSGMIIQASATVERDGASDIIASKLFTEEGALNGKEELEFTYEFDTMDCDDLQGIVEIRFCYMNKNGLLPMMQITATNVGYSVSYASSDPGAFYGIVPDNDTGVAIEKNQSYVLHLKLKPNKQGNGRLSCVLENRGQKKAAIVENWELAAEAQMKSQGELYLFINQSQKAIEPTPVVNLKRVAVSGYREDSKLQTYFTPADGAMDVTMDSDFSVTFSEAVNDITTEQVNVTGGSSAVTVDSVQMQDDGKKAVFTFDGLESDTAYTISLSDVLEQGAETAFDYNWSFTTGGPLSFGKIVRKGGGDLKSGNNTLLIPFTNASNAPFDATVVTAVCSGTEQQYIILNAFITQFTQIEGKSGNLELTVNLDSNTDRFIKTFVLQDGNHLVPIASEQRMYSEY